MTQHKTLAVNIRKMLKKTAFLQSKMWKSIVFGKKNRALKLG